MCTAIAWHQRNNSLDDRPAALEHAQEEECRRRRDDERRQSLAELEFSRAARREARSRLVKAAHFSARQVAAAIGQRAARKKAVAAEAEHRARAELVARVRGRR